MTLNKTIYDYDNIIFISMQQKIKSFIDCPQQLHVANIK
jgi:hypothetical protein